MSFLNDYLTILPGFSMPVCEFDSRCRWFQTLPPNSPIAGLSHISEHCVPGDGCHGMRVCLQGRPGGNSKETILWINGSEFTW